LATYTFELQGCTESNMEAVKAAIARIPGITSFSVTRSARGAFVLFIESNLSESDLLTALNAALAPLGVMAIGKPGYQPPAPSPVDGGSKPKF